jgi:hypothetical protein
MATKDKNTKKSMEKKPAQKTLKEKTSPHTARSPESFTYAPWPPLVLLLRTPARVLSPDARRRIVGWPRLQQWPT